MVLMGSGSLSHERGGKLKRLNEAFERFGDPARFG